MFTGTFEEVNEHFLRNQWSDGLPVVPPTMEKIEAFLQFTDRSPDEVLGIMHPSLAAATVWNVAVNGVMAGCRPEYMPVLLAIAEVMADPEYGLKHGGSTPGWEAMIIVNGPIREQLGFDDGQGAQRPGNQANTSIGRFYRLFARNVPRFLPGSTDMATFGQMFRAVVAENEQACAEMGWQPLHVTRGFKPDDSVVTITSVRTTSDPFTTAGEIGGAASRLHRRLGQADDRALPELARLRRDARAACSRRSSRRCSRRRGIRSRTWRATSRRTPWCRRATTNGA